MDFEHNSEELKREETQIDLNGGLVDAHFSLDDLFVSADYASSISSASPPHEWPQPQSWNRIQQSGDIDPSLFSAPLANGGPTHTSFDESMFAFGGMGMNNMIIDMSSNIYNQDMQITLQPSELHKSPQQQYHFIPPAMMSMAQANDNVEHSQDNDIAAVVKRLTGITNAQIAGAPNVLDYAIPAGFSDNSYSSASSDRSSVPPQTMEPVQPLTPASDAPAEGSPVASGARPKTAHTTIERRYRTNLNTCIVDLRHSIPAVRYLDKSYKHASGVQEKPDDRGFVDGVKAARKISKATIMSKAREYITVLKRREIRLQNEVTAMKDLLGSLVNGPLLVKAFEAEWAVRQAADAADDEMDSGDMDSDEGDDDESADERPRKKAKVSPALVAIAPVKPKKAPTPRVSAVAGAQAGADDVRPKKRGRPPKNAAAAAVRASPSSMAPTQTVHFTAPISSTSPSAPITPQAGHTQQFSFVPVVPQHQKRPAYLLASFVFLSFFKPSPQEVGIVPSDEGTNHSHLGRVLSSTQDENPFGVAVESPWYSHPLLHVAHTAIMIALFVALAVSLSPQGARNKVWRYLNRLSASTAVEEEKYDEKDTMTPLARAESELKSSSSTPKSKVKAFAALQAIPTPTSEQLALMALLRFSSKSSQATDLWAEAASSNDTSSPTTPAFELSLESACATLHDAASFADSRSPLAILASKAIETQLEETLKDAFVNDVIAICSDECSTPTASSEASKRARRRDDLAKRAVALGGRAAELVKAWEQAFVARAGSSDAFTLSSNSGGDNDTTGIVLLRALTLMHRIFPAATSSHAYLYSAPGSLPSPPPSPLPREELVKMERVLRVSLDAKVFHGKGVERCEEVQRARDMLISRLSQAARMRRLVVLEEQE